MTRLDFAPGSSIAYHTGDWRVQQPVYRDKWPPCSRACPCGEDIQAWLALANDHEWEAAWRKLTERNPLPAVLGRICFHPCEGACNRRALDTAVNVHALERELGDRALRNGWRHERLTARFTNRKVAVIGAGPAGLSFAFQMARHGVPVTLFEATDRPGGTLASGIPAYRLPRDVLEREIDAILDLGITLQTGVRIGTDRDVDCLRESFDAIFLAIGAQRPRRHPDGGAEGAGILTGLDFLHQVNTGSPPAVPSRVAVIGGGNTAMDAARCARRLGADVTVICAQGPHGSQPGHPDAEITALPEEVRQAEAEGIRIRYRLGVRRVVHGGGQPAGVEIARVDRLHDLEGRFHPRLFAGTEEFLPAGMVIFAIGQEVDWRGLDTLKTLSPPEVMVGGDAASGPRFAATAIGSGFQAASTLLARWVEGVTTHAERESREIPAQALNLAYYRPEPRQEPPASFASPNDFREIVPGLDAAAVEKEAVRCLSCGVCFHCGNCWNFCPDAAILRREDRFTVDTDYCKGCGICARECPCGHIDMESLLT